MTRGIVYFNLGSNYAIPLCVSLMSLRRHYAGQVAILADGHGAESARLIAADDRLAPITVRELDPCDEHVYLQKTKIALLSPFDKTAFIDSDTIIVGEIEELFPVGDEQIVVSSRFNGLTMNVKMRLRMKHFTKLDKRARALCNRNYPTAAINTGIFGIVKGSDFAAEWRKTALRFPDEHSVDEKTCQYLYPLYAHRVIDRRFNGNVGFDLATPDMRIWHGPRKQFWKWLGAGRWLYSKFLADALDGDFGNVGLLPHDGTFDLSHYLNAPMVQK